MNADGSDFQTLHTFTGGLTDGRRPNGSLLVVGSTLYGVTSDNGAFSGGAIYSMGLDGSNYQLLHSFAGADGAFPQIGLIQIGSRLYGTTYRGGLSDSKQTQGFGTIFSINLDGSDFRTEHFFTGTEGYLPRGELSHIGNTLFGTTTGGATIYALTVPEPSTLAMAIGGVALSGLAILRRQRRR
jgi:uncharacterized repeat protein (TIGR03803 family)